MPVATADPKAADPKKPAAPRDPIREAVETIVFVVVLVLLLKLFVTEAFVIPTGSMAETLYGYQKIVTCPQCQVEFPVNAHDEEEPNQLTGQYHPLAGCTCPACRFPIKFPVIPNSRPVRFQSPPTNTGDRVLVLKPIYHLFPPKRGDTVVFKYPEEPQQKQTAANYIKRVQGFGGETVGLHRGDLYVATIDYPETARDEAGNLLYPRPDDPNDLWKGDPGRGPDYRYPNNKLAVDLFEASRLAGFPGDMGFKIVRKPVEQLEADLRLVWDNDKQPKDLVGRFPTRWYVPAEGEARWKSNDPKAPTSFAHTGTELDFVRYRHLIYPWARPADAAGTRPTFVDNFLGYNAGIDWDPVAGRETTRNNTAEGNWVGDLVVSCDAQLADAAGVVVLELSKGQNRFQARFGRGVVTLASTGPGGKEFGARPCKVNGPGTYRLRFANVDCRLRVWVDGRLIDFGTDADYPPSSTVPPGKEADEGWTEENDVAAPASIGAQGDVTVRSITLHRDIYYTRNTADHQRADLFYVHPGHYLCLGDNSAQSSDGRKWGLVPERLMLGKAVFVFWPRWRIGFIK